MRKEERIFRNALLTLLLAATAVPLAARPCPGQDADAEKTSRPAPVTTANPDIPVQHLELLLKPLTKEELIVEADGWRDLLRAALTKIAQHQISVGEKKDVVQEAEQAEVRAEEEAEATGATDTDTERSAVRAAEEAAEVAKEQKEKLAEFLPKLKEKQAGLTERMTVVVDALEEKGGDVEEYRKYITAVKGIDLRATDAATIWTLVNGWLASDQGGRRWFWNLVKFFATLVAFYFGASILSGLVRRGASRIKDASQLLVDFLGRFVKQVLMIIGLIVALAALEVNIGPLLAAVGAAGFVIGFALQDTLSNFASGLLILAYRPFDVGDVIEAAEVSGIVDSVCLFSTHIRTFDNKVMIVPNNDIWGGTITNATASSTRRVDMVFGIGYDDDGEKASEIMKAILLEHDLIFDDPAPVVHVHELADSSVNFVCRPWCRTEDYWTVYWDVTRTVKEEFDRNGISIPFPQRDVHVYRETLAASGSHVSEHGGQDA